MEAPPGSGPSPGWTGKHAVELYVRTYTTMLQSSGDIKVESLVQAHLGMGSVLHPLAAQPQSDMGALLYAVRRLPAAIASCRRIIMGQSPQGFRAVLGAERSEEHTSELHPLRLLVCRLLLQKKNDSVEFSGNIFYTRRIS